MRLKKRIWLFLFFLLGIMVNINAQNLEITGKVTNQNDEPLTGATVMVKGTNTATIADIDGFYKINVPQSGGTIVVSYLGMKTIEKEITQSGIINFMMEDFSVQLSDVVVTALGIKREERALGYAVQKVGGDELQKVQGVDLVTSLAGKVAGLKILNPSDFNIQSTLTIRGEQPIIVIDGVPYENKNLNDIAPEDIESIDFLKGATASALYGARGGTGAVMVTTKNGSSGKTGLNVDFSTNNMFTAGYLAIPEVQTLYGRGENNTYQQTKDQTWGTVMDGSLQNQWDPIAKEFRDYAYLPVGADNFKNFLEQGFISNNNLSVGFKQKDLALRSSFNWTENKGRYPNNILDKYSYTLGGDVNFGKFQLTSNLSYARRHSPNMGSNGYTSYDPMYTLLLYSSADYNILDYKDNYWLIPGVLQNNYFGYDIANNSYSGKSQNIPYFDSYQRINETTRDIFNADVTAGYNITSWLKATLRTGLDFYDDIGQLRLSQGSYTSMGDTRLPYFTYRSGLTFNGAKTGAYLVGKTSGLSTNSDFILSGNKNFVGDKLTVEYMAGGSIYYKQDENINAITNGGISVPEFFSLAASVNPATVAEERRAQQVNSTYGRLGLSWNRMFYVDATARNDWASTLTGRGIDPNKKSYFYPSISGSVILSEFLGESTKDWLDYLKLRSTWSQYKSPPDIYAVNSVYTSVSSIWNDYSGTYAPSSLYDLDNIRPSAFDMFETGLSAYFYKKRLTFDVAYYQKRKYDAVTYGPLSTTSGYSSILINTDEERTTKGWDVVVTTTPVKSNNIRWDIGANWGTYKEYYTKLDDTYSTVRPWIQVGNRVDAYTIKDFQVVPSGEFAGQYVYINGVRQKNNYYSVIGYQNPDWIWGLNTTLTYNNWSFFASFDGVVGGLTKSTTEAYMWLNGVHPGTLTDERAADVANPGTKNYLASGVKVVSGTLVTDANTGEVISDNRVFATNDIYTTYRDYIRTIHGGTEWGGTGTTEDIYDRTFFKLREISLTYKFSDKLLKKLGTLKNVSIGIIGQNVMLVSKDFNYSDPDGYNTVETLSDPSSRYVGFNIKLSL